MTAKLEQLDELYAQAAEGGGAEAMERLAKRNKMPVSYTHLTLPTSDLV